MNSNIKTFENACEALNYTTIIPIVEGLPTKHGKAIVADYKLGIITEALNQEANDGKPWEPNWNNTNEIKYFPWPYVNASSECPSGSGFSGFGFAYAYSSTFVGSRHCFKNRDICKYAFNQFNELYKEKLLLIK